MFDIKRLGLIFFCIIFCFSNNLYGVIVFLNGPTCSGKSSIAKEFLKKIDKSNWEYVALDNLNFTVSGNACTDDDEYRRQLNKKTFNFIKNNVGKGKNILLDTVIDNESYFDSFKEKLKKLNRDLFLVFVYCSFEKLVEHLNKRNSSGVEKEKRTFFQVLHAFGKFYKKVDESEEDLGNFDLSNFEKISKQLITKNYDRFMWSFRQIYDIFSEKDNVNFNIAFGQYNLIVDSRKNSSKECSKKIKDALIDFLKRE